MSSVARLHRRLVSGMALSALVAFAAGAGVTPAVVGAAGALAVSVAALPPKRAGAWIERVTRFGVLGLCLWLVYGSVAMGRDFMPGVVSMLLFLLAGESLRPLDARNDMRLYSLSFALLIASTAYAPGPGFAVGFVAFVALAVLGMMVGYLRRETERFRGGEVRLGGRFLWTTAGLSLVTLAMSGAVFVAFPRLPRAWNVQGRRGAGDEVAGFSDQVSIGEFGGRIGSNPQVMFRVDFPGGRPADVEDLHWRGRSFDAFDGTRWIRAYSPLNVDLSPREYMERWGGRVIEARVMGGPPGADVLFGLQPVLGIRRRSAIRPYRGLSGDWFFAGTDNPVYTVYSAARRPTDDELRAAEDPAAPVPRNYLQLPALDPRIWRLADSLTVGKTARIDQVRAVEGWLKSNFTYTLDLPSSEEDATVEGFLFRRRAGHCEYFSTALAVLLRARGIPARNVNGFLGGEWNDGENYLAVTGDHAHSWVEVWFAGWGWVPFDATPPGTADLLSRGTRDSWLWGTRQWLDGVEYRWYKWVIDYDLDRQLDVFHGVRDFFGQGSRASRRTGGREVRVGAPWLVGIVGLALLWALASLRRRGPRPRAVSRAYLSLRRAYARAGWTAEDGAGPLDFARALEREHAPGADDAARAVDAYLRARFAAADDDATRRELSESASRAKSAIRRAGKRRRAAA
jgi:transglutaminase-like putative cysteine protease